MDTPGSTNFNTKNTENIQNRVRSSSSLNNRVVPINSNEISFKHHANEIEPTNLKDRNCQKAKKISQEIAYVAKNIGDVADAFKTIPGAKEIAKGVQTTTDLVKNVTTVAEKAAERGFFDPKLSVGEKFSILIETLASGEISDGDEGSTSTLAKSGPIEDAMEIVGESAKKTSDALSLMKNFPSIGDKVDGLIILAKSIETMANAFAQRSSNPPQGAMSKLDQSIEISKMVKEASKNLKNEATLFTKTPGIKSAAKTVKVLSGLAELCAEVAEEVVVQMKVQGEDKLQEILPQALRKVMDQRETKDASRPRIVRNVAKGLDEFGRKIGDKVNQSPVVKRVNELTQSMSQKIDNSKLGKSLDELDNKMKNVPIFSPLFKEKTPDDEIRIAGDIKLGAEITSTVSNILKDLPVAGMGFAFTGILAKATGFFADVSREIIKIQEGRIQDLNS